MPGLLAGRAFVDVVPNTKNFGRALGGEVQRSVRGVGDVGRSLTKTLTPLAIGAGAIFRSAFNEVDSGLDAIRAGTGATGEELNKLGGSMKAVAGRVTAPISQVGEVLADLQTRTGQTGESLETLTQRTLELSRIQGGDALRLSETLTRAFGDWSVATEDQSEAMDKLFRASQATGPPVDKLADLVVRFGAPLRQFCFGLAESAALLGKFEKEGVNTELVMGSLRQGLGKLAREGVKDIPGAFKEIVSEIQNAGDAGQANARAMEIFGARAGPDMAAAIREGRFDLGELFSVVSEGTETIEAANADTLDFGDRLTMLKNRAQAVIGPVGEMGMAFAGVAAGVGPALVGMGKLGKAGPVLGKAIGGIGGLLTNPFVLLTAAVVGVGFLIFKFRDQIWGALQAIGRFFMRVFGGIRDFLAQWGPFILPLILGPIGVILLIFLKFKDQAVAVFRAIAGFIIGVWQRVKGVSLGIWRAITGAIKGVIGGLTAVFRRVFDGYRRIIVGVWNTIRSVTSTVWGAIKSAILTPIRVVRNTIRQVLGIISRAWGTAWDAMKTKVGGVFEGMKNVVKGALNFIIGLVERGINLFLAPLRKLSKAPVIGRGIPDIPEISIPRLARGGDIVASGLAMIVEKGPELVELPKGARVTPLPAVAASDRRPDERRQLVLQVSGRFETAEQIAEAVDWHQRVRGW